MLTFFLVGLAFSVDRDPSPRIRSRPKPSTAFPQGSFATIVTQMPTPASEQEHVCVELAQSAGGGAKLGATPKIPSATPSFAAA